MLGLVRVIVRNKKGLSVGFLYTQTILSFLNQPSHGACLTTKKTPKDGTIMESRFLGKGKIVKKEGYILSIYWTMRSKFPTVKLKRAASGEKIEWKK